MVALPLKSAFSFAFGRVTGDYQYKEVSPNVKHIRDVKWIETVPRSTLPEPILFSMNSALTIFKVSRNDAESRVNVILKLTDAARESATEDISEEEETALGESKLNLKAIASDEILKFIQTKFHGHALARLIEAILKAEGYKTRLSLPGPDGGVDIVAGFGMVGFDEPRLCVQVKSGGAKADLPTLNQLRGVMTKYGSQHGLLVSWGDFTTAVKTSAREDFFKVRLWDQGDVVKAVQKHYDRLGAEIRAELPLKQIWILVNEDIE